VVASRAYKSPTHVYEPNSQNPPTLAGLTILPENTAKLAQDLDPYFVQMHLRDPARCRSWVVVGWPHVKSHPLRTRTSTIKVLLRNYELFTVNSAK
jgi:hypothetical protein